MKVFTLLASILITCISCNCQKKAVEQSSTNENQIQDGKMVMNQESVFPVLEYEAMTRGSYKKIVVKNQVLSVTSGREQVLVETKITDADWKEIVSLYKTVDIKGLESLKAPSEKRFYDGAPIAHFAVITDDTTYQSADFDGGFPPAQIQKIVTKLTTLAEKQE